MSPSDYVVNTYSYIWQKSAEDCIQHLADQGYRKFEVLLTAPHLWPADFDQLSRRRFTRRLRQLDSQITSLNAGGFDNNLVSPAANVREFTLKYLRDAIDLASDMDVPHVVISPGIGRPLLVPPTEWLLGWFHAGMESLVPHAESRDVQLLVENIPFAFLPRAEELMNALEGYPVDRVAVVYDTANAVFAREDLVAGFKLLAPRLRLVHICDTPLDVWRHEAVGRGAVPFRKFAAALKDMRYEHLVVFEIASHDPDRDIQESILRWQGLSDRDHRRV